MVPNPPGRSTKAWDSFMNISLRVKKYLKLMSFGSSAMTGLASASNGRTMLTPKLRSAPAPSWPASMIPGPAPVMIIQSRAASASARSRAQV